MSVKLMSLVWDADLQQTEKLVMLALADWANDEGICWPKQKTIATRCCTSERQVRRLIDNLVERGLISKQNNGRAGTTYQIHVEALQKTGHPRPVKTEEKPDTHVRLNEPEKRTSATKKPDTHVRSINRSTKNHQDSSATLPTPRRSKRKPKEQSDHAWLTRWWCHAFLIITGSQYAFAGKKHGGILKQLLDQLGLEEVVTRACVYLTLPQRERFPRGSPTLEGLAAMINQLGGRCTEDTEDRCYGIGLLPDYETKLKEHKPWEQPSEDHQLSLH